MASYKFKVGKAPLDDIGRGRVRIHYSRRNGAKRFTVFRISNGDVFFLASVLGHEEEDDKILLDIDQRADLSVDENGSIELTLTRVGFCGRVRWYLSVPDPAVHVPAWLAVWSVALGALGLILGSISLAR
ncbi:hypothetical protein NA8A_23799 [Nitratireductor indicus C115]|uniref:Uncharacterized protein n=1 Tax=Nitratireductor indicus C115 TaxID=1231190 RepID=K2PFT0_9HYPH|nr:hypothetical protein [Nitratireductor indicus]EKF39862.1 hypothetical protein NA8A_23799 [Nitratireductor indicus C115]SFQ82130.1 hypothetical protein SAMN05216176_1283 [Nitratireductor indicus]